MLKHLNPLAELRKSKVVKRALPLMFSALLIISQTSCSSNNIGSGSSIEPVSATEYDLLNTTCTITIYDMVNSDASKLISESFELCREYENLLSKTIEGSDIYKLNHSTEDSVEVSDSTYELLKKALYYGNLSEGRFDVSIGKLTNLWDFKTAPHVPAAEDIEAALPTINYKDHVLIADHGPYVTKGHTDTEVDLGGIAKGYIADKVAGYLIEKDVEKAIINLGGNIVALGSKAEDTQWKIGIEKPYTDRRDIVGSIEVENKTVVTSGVYERCFQENGVLYHHILDPKTGYPCTSDVNSVTLVAPVGMSADCDALSTICLMLGVEEGLKLIESIDGIEASFIDLDGEIHLTSGMNFTPVE